MELNPKSYSTKMKQFDEVMREMRQRHITPSWLKIDGEKAKTLYNITGNFIKLTHAENVGDYIDVCFNAPDNPTHRLYLGQGFYCPFAKLYITAPDTNGEVTLTYGNDSKEFFDIIGDECCRRIAENTKGLFQTAEKTQLISTAYVSNSVSSALLYTVPAGKVLYITSAFVNALTTLNFQQVGIEISSVSFLSLYTHDLNDNNLHNIASNFIPALVFNSGTSIYVVKRTVAGVLSASEYAQAGITGYLL